MKLYAISDLHLERAINRQALAEMPEFPDDWLIVAGDMAELESCFRFGLEHLTQRFDQVIWVPGNHELWTMPSDHPPRRGQEKYEHFVRICHEYEVVTPEDPFLLWPGEGAPTVLAPLFLLYDYSFGPEGLSEAEAIAWAQEKGLLCTDESLLHPDPYPSRSAWCEARCRYSEERLAAIASCGDLILINHYPLRQDLARLPLIPRFSIWCGTRRTEDWHLRYPCSVVVYGHLHIPKTHYRDGIRFEEVSVGYPRQWKHQRGLVSKLRQILPHPV